MISLRHVIAASLVIAGGALFTHAGTILQPDAVTTSMGSINPTYFAVDNLGDQSGLSVGYTSTVDDFDTYIASAPTHPNQAGTAWLSANGNPTGNVNFSLGGPVTIESFALWNYGSDSTVNIIDFTLLADDNPTFSSPTVLGSFSANPNTGPANGVLAEVFSFAPTDASYVRMQITSNNGHTFTGAGEAAFEVFEIVPEPASIFLAAIGLASLLIVVGRRRVRAKCAPK